MAQSEDIRIRFAKEEDIPDIMAFIDTHWKKEHILGCNEELFRYEWVQEGKVNVALAVEGNKIVGMEGFIPYSRQHRDIMTTVWKVTKTSRPMLGMEILDYIKSNADVRSISSPGINKKTVELYDYLGYETGTMIQWYRLNPKARDFKIASVQNMNCPSSLVPSTGIRFTRYERFIDLEQDFSFAAYYAQNPLPLKEEWYVEHRYFQHPIYRYDVYGAGEHGKNAETLLVFRFQEVQGDRALRLVDVIGNHDMLYRLTPLIDELMLEQRVEYVDMYEKGMDSQSLLDAGWLAVADSGNIIPNYFSPFVKENIDIHYFTSEPKIKLFKADGDQDRPN